MLIQRERGQKAHVRESVEDHDARGYLMDDRGGDNGRVRLGVLPVEDEHLQPARLEAISMLVSCSEREGQRRTISFAVLSTPPGPENTAGGMSALINITAVPEEFDLQSPSSFTSGKKYGKTSGVPRPTGFSLVLTPTRANPSAMRPVAFASVNE